MNKSKQLVWSVIFVGLMVFLFLPLLLPTQQVQGGGCAWNDAKGTCDDTPATETLGYPLDQSTVIMIALAHGRSVVYTEATESTPSTLAVVGFKGWSAKKQQLGNIVVYHMSQDGVVGLMRDMGRTIPRIPTNGDGICQKPETHETTPADCAPPLPSNGNGICESTESDETAPMDCPANP